MVRQLLFYLDKPGVNGIGLHVQLVGQPSESLILGNQFFIHIEKPTNATATALF